LSLDADDGFAERDRRRRAQDNSGQGVVPSGQDALSLRIVGDSEGLSPCQQQYARMMGMALLAKRNGETDAVAFARYIGTPEGRAGYDEYRTSHLSIVGKSFGLVAKRAPVLDDPEDPYDGSPEDALDEVEDEVKKLCAKGVTPVRRGTAPSPPTPSGSPWPNGCGS